jgi:HEAT repeat protein
MRSCRALFLFAGLCVLMPGRPVAIADHERDQADEQRLQAAGLRTDGGALLDFLRKRSLAVAEPARVEALCRQLGAASPEARVQAAAELVALGNAAIPLLRRTVQDPDEREAAARARRCLRLLVGDQASNIPAAVIRLLARRKPAGATEVLLEYLPFADNEMVVKEVQAALGALAFRDGKPEPVLVRALGDKVGLRRVVAAEILVASGGAEQWAAARRLLRDPKPAVRLRAALALAAVRVEEAIPVLITLLNELPADMARQAEEYLVNLAGDDAPKMPLGNNAASQQKCRAAWVAWWGKYEGPALLAEFRKRTPTDDFRAKVLTLIKRFGDESFDVREKACFDVMKVGKPAVFLLRQALSDPDPEISQRAQKCLLVLDKGGTANVPAVAARLVALRKPAGAADALLAYVPFIEDDTAADEVQMALTALAFRDGRAEPALLSALDDKIGLRRAAAAEALCQAGSPEQHLLLRKLLKDPEPAVRGRVALALAGRGGDREAVPVLIASLGELAGDQGSKIEDYLYRLAGDRAPSVPLGSDAAARQKFREAWSNWWRDQGPKVELVRLDMAQSLLGYTLLIMNQNGRIVEVGRNGQPRWQIEGLQNPVDARVVPGNRVLIAEHGNRVSERDFQGNIIWSKQDFTDQPVSVQRLHNGNTFIATEDELLELDRTQKKIFTLRHPGSDIQAAFKFRDGHIVFVTRRGQCTRLDATGKQVKNFAIRQNDVAYGGMDGLANGRILVAHTNTGKVVEYDIEGKVVWEASVPQPTAATRLPNGNTLVASSNNQRVVEVDRAGRVVSEHKDGNRPWKARRR